MHMEYPWSRQVVGISYKTIPYDKIQLLVLTALWRVEYKRDLILIGQAPEYPHLDMVGRFHGDHSHWRTSNPTSSLFATSAQFDWPPLSPAQFALSLSNLVPEIPGPKVDLIFHQNFYLTDFKHIVSIFF